MVRDKNGQEFEVGTVVKLPHGIAKIQGIVSGNTATIEDVRKVAMQLSSCRDPKVYYAHEVEVVREQNWFGRIASRLFGAWFLAILILDKIVKVF